LAEIKAVPRLLRVARPRWRFLLRALGRCACPLNRRGPPAQEGRNPLLQRDCLLPRPVHTLPNRWAAKAGPEVPLQPPGQLRLEGIFMWVDPRRADDHRLPQTDVGMYRRHIPILPHQQHEEARWLRGRTGL